MYLPLLAHSGAGTLEQPCQIKVPPITWNIHFECHGVVFASLDALVDSYFDIAALPSQSVTEGHAHPQLWAWPSVYACDSGRYTPTDPTPSALALPPTGSAFGLHGHPLRGCGAAHLLSQVCDMLYDCDNQCKRVANGLKYLKGTKCGLIGRSSCTETLWSAFLLSKRQIRRG